MYTIHGYSTFNGVKVMLTAEELGLDYEYAHVDLGKLENKAPEFLAMNPMGKIPVLQHNDLTIIESGAICRYLSRANDHKLYSSDPATAAKIDQVMDVMSNHIGRHLGDFFWQEIIMPTYFKKEPKQSVLDQAKEFLDSQLPYFDQMLVDNAFLCGDEVTIADTFSYACFEVVEHTSADISEFKNLVKWYEAFKQRPSVAKVYARFPAQ